MLTCTMLLEWFARAQTLTPKTKKKRYGLVLYVDADTGSDGNVGSISQPFQTLAFAVLKAKIVPEGAR